MMFIISKIVKFGGIIYKKLNVMLKLIDIFSVVYGFSELMQRMFKYGDILSPFYSRQRAEHFSV